MTQKYDGIVMLSGGLDSIMTTHLLKKQGLRLLALHYVLPFYSGLGLGHHQIKNYAKQLDIPLRIEEEGEEYLAMIRNPEFGFGKNANPCLDCRIHRLLKAKAIMHEVGASFIATGEVIGQRPKSQRLECLHVIENRAGLDGRLLRPLSAQLLAETIPEKEGLVDRSQLLDFHGRNRKPQLAYAKANGLRHNPPAGGCLLTNEGPSQRYLVLAEKYPDFDYIDFRLVAYGRHFQLTPECRLVVARDDRENDILEMIIGKDDCQVDLTQIPGPLGILRGTFGEVEMRTAASFVARYSRARNDASVNVKVFRNTGEIHFFDVTPALPEACETCLF